LNLPKEFLKSLPLPESEILEFQNSLDEELKSSFRLNPSKAKPAFGFEKVPWSKHGFYLDKRPRFTSNPPFHAGAFYAQEASSMFISHVLEDVGINSKPIVALDLCAAPGGKTTLLQSELHKHSLIQANETIQSRFKVLIENTTKWGVPNICVSNCDPARFSGLDNFYDLILVDAPCSGEGLFRKQKNAVEHWSIRAVEHCSARQKRILADIWPSLKKDGLLIYSTCTYNRLENEENLKWLKSRNDLEFLNIDISGLKGIQEVNDGGVIGYRFFPHLVQGEGFFCSVIRKQDGVKVKRNKTKKFKLKILKSFQTHYEFLKDGQVYAGQEEQIENLEILLSHFEKSIKPGLELGKLLKGSVLYDHGMAMINNNDEQDIEQILLGLGDALKYLKKEDVSMNKPRGRYIIQFNEFNLGFAKSDQRRLISQYPKNWRILKSSEEEYTPLVRPLK